MVCLLDRLPPSWNITDLAEAIIWENRCCFNVINLKWNRKKWHCPNVFGAKIQEYFATSFWDGIYSFVEITALARGWWTTQEEESGIWTKKSPPPCFFTPALSYFSMVFVMERNWQLKYPNNRSDHLSRPINYPPNPPILAELTFALLHFSLRIFDHQRSTLTEDFSLLWCPIIWNTGSRMSWKESEF